MQRISVYKNTEDLPFTLTGGDVAAALNISRAGAYNLMKKGGFPALKIGKRVVVPKGSFLRWMEENTGKQVEV